MRVLIFCLAFTEILPATRRQTSGHRVITGYNTDVEYDGVVYHVQTEDKGVQTPIILSLVYVGGAILASKRAPYDDLIAAGFDKQVLTERLQRQHKLICAAVHAGRIEDLKRMSERDAVEHEESAPAPSTAPSQAPSPAAPPTPTPAGLPADLPALAAPAPAAPPADSPAPSPAAPALLPVEPPAELPAALPALAAPAPAPLPATPLAAPKDALPDVAAAPEDREPFSLRLLDEPELRGGRSVVLQLLVTRFTNDTRAPAARARVLVRTLGTAFQPQTIETQTDAHGRASVSLSLPKFQKGRAAILIKVQGHGETAELRRIVLPSS